MRLVGGADGCKKGWVLMVQDLDTNEVWWRLCRNAEALVHGEPTPMVTGVDIPIGLTLSGARECDQAARRLLGRGRASSVFPAPIRPVLKAQTYQEACEARFAVEGKRMSKQAWAIVPKIRDIDSVLQENPGLQGQVREVHPEVSFYYLAEERPMKHSKKRRAGHEERRVLLERLYGDAVGRALAARRELAAAADDILDAFVALWTAERMAQGRALTIPETPPVDTTGLRMEIVA